MERPFAVIGFSWMAALTAAVFLGAEISLRMIAVFAVLFIITLIVPFLRKTVVYPVVLGSVILALTTFCVYHAAVWTPVEDMQQNNVTITAQLCDLPFERNGVYWYTFQTESVSSETADYPQCMKLQISSSKALNMDLYDTLSGQMTLYAYDDSSYGNYIHSKGIQFTGYLHVYEDIEIAANTNKPLFYYALCIKQAISEEIEYLLPEDQSDFLQAVLLGNKNVYTPDEKANFSTAGVSHIIVVSGFHLSVLTQLLLMVFLKIFKRRPLPAFLAAVFVFLFMAVTGFSSSVLRAGIMQFVVLAAMILYREADSLNSLGLAALIISLLNPYAAADTGFLLSFTATLGIIVWYPKMLLFSTERIFDVHDKTHDSLLYKLKKPITASLSVVFVTVSALIFSLPISILSFHSAALYTVLTNLLVTVPVSLIIGTALFMLLFGCIPFLLPLSHLCAAICGALSNVVLTCINTVAGLPYASIDLSQNFIPLWLAATILLCVFVFLIKNRHGMIKYVVFLSGAMLAVGLVSFQIVHANIATVTVTDTGEGTALVIKKNGQSAIIFSNAANYSAVSNCVNNADYFLLTSWSQGRSAEKLLKSIDVHTIEVYNEPNVYERLHEYIYQSDQVILSDNTAPHTVQWQGIDIQSFTMDGLVYVFFQVNNDRFLILPENADCTHLPATWRCAEFCIISGTIENTDMISVSTLIISADALSEQSLTAQFYTCADSVYTTCGRGDLTLSFYTDQTLTIGRRS